MRNLHGNGHLPEIIERKLDLTEEGVLKSANWLVAGRLSGGGGRRGGTGGRGRRVAAGIRARVAGVDGLAVAVISRSTA